MRTPVFTEMINIVNNKEVTFSDFKFDREFLKNSINNFVFWNQRPVTKSILTWWAFQNENQKLIELTEIFEIEHIYAKNRNSSEHSLSDDRYIDLLGNKAILEKRINIRASDYRFIDKKKYYKGYINQRNQERGNTANEELKELAESKDDFTEKDILNRNSKIIDSFIEYIDKNGLIK